MRLLAATEVRLRAQQDSPGRREARSRCSNMRSAPQPPNPLGTQLRTTEWCLCPAALRAPLVMTRSCDDDDAQCTRWALLYQVHLTSSYVVRRPRSSSLTPRNKKRASEERRRRRLVVVRKRIGPLGTLYCPSCVAPFASHPRGPRARQGNMKRAASSLEVALATAAAAATGPSGAALPEAEVLPDALGAFLAATDQAAMHKLRRLLGEHELFAAKDIEAAGELVGASRRGDFTSVAGAVPQATMGGSLPSMSGRCIDATHRFTCSLCTAAPPADNEAAFEVRPSGGARKASAVCLWNHECHPVDLRLASHALSRLARSWSATLARRTVRAHTREGVGVSARRGPPTRTSHGPSAPTTNSTHRLTSPSCLASQERRSSAACWHALPSGTTWRSAPGWRTL